MTREWQEATNRRLKELGIEPISGPGSEGYKVPSAFEIHLLTIQGRGVLYGDIVNKASRQKERKEQEEE